jgi:hypothetical protein
MPNNVMANSFRDERGMALVMSMLVLVMLSSLIIAFSVLSSTEPTIANNQLRVAQARALAEGGMERAAWALTMGKACASVAPPGSCPAGLAFPLPATIPAPYDGSTLLTVSAGNHTVGGFRVTVSPQDPARPHERDIAAVGWVPTDAVSDTHTKAHQKITATLITLGPPNLPCAVCVRGDIQIGGSSTIDSRADTSCGAKYGTWSTTVKDSDGNVISPGLTVIGSGASKVYGAVDGNSTANEATDMKMQQDQADFDKGAFTNADLDLLKSYARSAGTYYQGAVTFNAANKIPNGIIFVDTVSGNNIVADVTPTSDYGTLTISGNPSVDPTGFHGWIIVNGSLSISGNIQIYGMTYAVNDMSYVGIGTGKVVGQMISANIKDTIASVIDTNLAGNSSVTYDCQDATSAGGIIPQSFVLKAGSYKEVAD